MSSQITEPKFIVITGGVISGIGKGITASSIGVLMKMRGCRVVAVKIDPYLNVDAGTMSPLEHGECYVLDDGSETDLDLGNYERFLSVNLTERSNITTGKIYSNVIAKERRGDYLGKTVQIIPHISNEIIENIENVSKDSDVCMIELGGTVGDIESAPFVEALRQLKLKVGKNRFSLVHVSMVPEIAGEHKSKPTQHSVRELMSLGLIPDFIVCRSLTRITPSLCDKIALHCNLSNEMVIPLETLNNIYDVPSVLMNSNIDSLISKQLDLSFEFDIDFSEAWFRMAENSNKCQNKLEIAIVGKYCQNDAYLSIKSALMHAGISANCNININFIDSENINWPILFNCDGILVPGGFGNRGIDGKLEVIRYARERNVPFLGICLGMQLAVIEFARNVMNIPDANSSEFSETCIGTTNEYVLIMPDLENSQMGASMRLGAKETIITTGSLAEKIYNKKIISERHRHRYEINPLVIDGLKSFGLYVSGIDVETNNRADIIEIIEHKFFFGCQYHPEYKSRPLDPSPPFLEFIKCAHNT
tara:strand:- start:6412 stop:8013 length:1602 start_codon:yes stop_codon:yes gene_type:complete